MAAALWDRHFAGALWDSGWCTMGQWRVRCGTGIVLVHYGTADSAGALWDSRPWLLHCGTGIVLVHCGTVLMRLAR